MTCQAGGGSRRFAQVHVCFRIERVQIFAHLHGLFPQQNRIAFVRKLEAFDARRQLRNRLVILQAFQHSQTAVQSLVVPRWTGIAAIRQRLDAIKRHVEICQLDYRTDSGIFVIVAFHGLPRGPDGAFAVVLRVFEALRAAEEDGIAVRIDRRSVCDASVDMRIQVVRLLRNIQKNIQTSL